MEDYFRAKRRLFELLPPGGIGVVESRRPARSRVRAAAAAPGDLRD